VRQRSVSFCRGQLPKALTRETRAPSRNLASLIELLRWRDCTNIKVRHIIASYPSARPMRAVGSADHSGADQIGSSGSSAGVSGLVIAPLYGIESSFCKAAMARSGSLVTAVTPAKISRTFGPSIAFFSNRPGAFWLLTRQAVFQNKCE